MNNLRLSLIALLLAAFGAASAQEPLWDREKYPDLPDPKDGAPTTSTTP